MKAIEQKKLDRPKYVIPGDQVTLMYQDEKLLSREIKTERKIDTLIIFETEEGELGLKAGIGGIFGEGQS